MSRVKEKERSTSNRGEGRGLMREVAGWSDDVAYRSQADPQWFPERRKLFPERAFALHDICR